MKIVVLTSHNSADDVIVNRCDELGVPCFRGSEYDVAKRFLDCAHLYGIKHIVRIPSDDPFIPCNELLSILDLYKSLDGLDYLSSTLEPKSPIGFHVEVFPRESLENAYKKSSTNSLACEHVTPAIYNDSAMKLQPFPLKQDYSRYRLTIDYYEDLEFARALAKRLINPIKSLDQIVESIESFPSLFNVNSMHSKSSTITL